MASALVDMKNTFLEKKEDLRYYLCQAIGAYSDPGAQAAEQKWMLREPPDISDLRQISMMMYQYPRPLTAENWRHLCERLMIGSD